MRLRLLILSLLLSFYSATLFAATVRSDQVDHVNHWKRQGKAWGETTISVKIDEEKFKRDRDEALKTDAEAASDLPKAKHKTG